MIRILLTAVLMMMLIGIGSKSKAEVPPAKISCSSLATVDMQNITIKNIAFVDGEACTSDSDEMPDHCDWEHSISRDEILKPIPDKEVRLVILRSDHVIGTGSWDTVLVFDCFNGSMINIFDNKYLGDVNIRKKTDSEIIITSFVWQSKDPMCCPSKEQHDTYRWSLSKKTYLLQSTTTSKRN